MTKKVKRKKYQYKRIKLKGGRLIDKHRLVMERHIGRRLKNCEIIHHINGDKKDDRIENLEVTTRAEHARHHMGAEEREKLSFRSRGEKSNMAKLNEDKVKKIRKLFDNGLSPYKIGPMFNVDSETARQAAKRITWKHVI